MNYIELAKQAGFQDADWNYDKGLEKALKQFAELIVRECSGFVYNYPEKYLTRNQAREICMSMEEHFGVDE